MTWVLYASFMPLLWSLGNVLDQYIAREAFQRSAFSFLIISGLVTLPLAIVLAFLNPHVLQIPLPAIFALMTGGMIGFAGAWPYIIAITKDDASNAIPVLQTVPVFVYLLGFILLGETLSGLQVWAGCWSLPGRWPLSGIRIHEKSIR